MVDILGIGEALIEYSEESEGIYRQSFAGDVLNTLYYASRLGAKTSFLSSFGKDRFTDDLILFLNRSNIDHSQCSISNEKNNGLYIIRNSNDGEPQFTFFRENSAARETNFNTEKTSGLFADAKVILLSAIGLAVLHNIDTLIDTLRETPTTATIYFDLNVRESLWQDINILKLRLKELAPIISVLSLSVADHEKLFGRSSSADIVEYYSSLGYKTIIVRNSGGDVTVFENGKTSIVAVERCENVVDATGAGDAFNGGCIVALLKENTLNYGVECGNRAARQVLTARGGIVPSFDPKEVIL